MNSTIDFPFKKMKRSKSLNALPELVTDVNLYIHGESVDWEQSKSLVDDSGLQSSDAFISLEKKVDKLNDMCTEQSRVLSELMEHIRSTQRLAAEDEHLVEVLGDLLQKVVDQRENGEARAEGGARSLLSAIEARPSLERRVCTALTDLLQSEGLKQSIVSATAVSMKEVIQSMFSAELSSLYVPAMERAHRQLLKQVSKLVTNAFSDLEQNTASTAGALRRSSQSLEAALRRHQALLQSACGDAERVLQTIASTTEKVIERELKQWREDFFSALPAASDGDSGRAESPGPFSPVQSVCASPESADNSSGNMVELAVPELSAIDRMMITAEINKLIKEGDVNGAFTKALLAMDLSLVLVACRAAAPALAARPAPAQPVLLSLLQQLSTDLVQETQLKCRYIEYALRNLRPQDAVTRAHLPFVVGELNEHLAKFCLNYPHHALFHTITQIIVTARNLL